MSSPTPGGWPAVVLPWLLAAVLLFVVAAVAGFGAAYMLASANAVPTVNPAFLPTPSRPATATPGPASATPLATPSLAASPTSSPGTEPPASQSAAPSPSAPTPAPTPIRYVVKRGDRLYQIAAQFGVTVDEIVELNNLENPDLIVAGQVLLIPVH